MIRNEEVVRSECHGLRELADGELAAVEGGLSFMHLPLIVVRMLAPILYGGTAPLRVAE